MKKIFQITISMTVLLSVLLYSLSAAAIIYWTGTNYGSTLIATSSGQGTAVVKNDGAGGKKLTDAYNRITGENLTKPTPSSSGEHISENYVGNPASSCYSYTIETDFILFDDKTTLGQTFTLYDELPGVSSRKSNWYDLYRISADGITVTSKFSDTDKTVFDGVSVGQWHSFAASFTWEVVDAGKNHYALTGMKFWLDGKGPVTKTLLKKTYGVYRFAFGAFSKTADYGIDNIRHCVDKEYTEPGALPEITSEVYRMTEDTIRISGVAEYDEFSEALTPSEGCEIVLFSDSTLTSTVTDGAVTFGNIAAVRSDSKVQYYEITQDCQFTYKITGDSAVITGPFVDENSVAADFETLDIPSEINGFRVTAVGDYAFAGTTPDGFNYLGFKIGNVYPIKYVNVPDTVTSIGNGVFWNCTNLRTFEMPDTVTSLGTNVFRLCNNLSYVKLSNGITSIPSGTFYNNRSLSGLVLPPNVTSAAGDALNMAGGYTDAVNITVYGNTKIERSISFDNTNVNLTYQTARIELTESNKAVVHLYENDAVCLVAQYDDNGALTGFSPYNIEYNGDSWYAKSAEIALPESYNIMVIEDFTEIRPLTKNKTNR